MASSMQNWSQELDENCSPNVMAQQSSKEYKTAPSPLLFFLDLETTGLLVDTVTIIEIGVKVIPSSENNFEFQSLVRTSQDIPTIVESLTGIKNADLSDKDPFPVVFQDMLTKINTTTQNYSMKTGKNHYPVLVAHKGFTFDFPILLAEINRSQLDTTILVDHNIHFADSLALLQKAKKDGCESLKDAKLGLKALFNKFFPNKEFIGHRAIADVEAMEELFTSTTLGDLLPKLNIRTPQEQIQLWTRQKQKRANVRQLRKRFKTITKEHAQQLDRLDITFEILSQWKDKAENANEFKATLQRKKVRSSVLREKLCLFFFGRIDS